MHSSRESGAKGLSVLFQFLWGWLQQRRERSQQRRWLMEMDDRLLKDIGLCRADVHRLYQRKVSGPAHERSKQKSQEGTRPVADHEKKPELQHIGSEACK